MNPDKLNDALNEIRDEYIAEAIHPKKRSFPWIGAIAAVLAVVLLIQNLPGLIALIPPAEIPPVRLTATVQPISAHVLAPASAYRSPQRPDTDSSDSPEWREYADQLQEIEDSAAAANAQALDFYTSGSAIFLASEAENKVWSPLSAYMALAMLAEATGGNSRQQILDALGAADIEALRAQVSAVWETAYVPIGDTGCVLANSLWLEDGVAYDETTVDTLAYAYYADVYQGDLGSEQINADIQAWLNNHTGGLLTDAVKNAGLDPRADPLIALYSTVYFNANWINEFRAEDNTSRLFHSPTGATLATFMNQTDDHQLLFWGDSYSAVNLSMRMYGCDMWLILPDEDKTVEDVLAQGQYMDMVTGFDSNFLEGWNDCQSYKINLSLPKFDVSAELDLIGGLRELGITDAFDWEKANFSASITDRPAYVNQANHAARVVIDEEGVTAAAYTEIGGDLGFNPPPELEEIDFILDRPFIFVISVQQMPLFAGVVNEP